MIVYGIGLPFTKNQKLINVLRKIGLTHKNKYVNTSSKFSCLTCQTYKTQYVSIPNFYNQNINNYDIFKNKFILTDMNNKLWTNSLFTLNQRYYIENYDTLKTLNTEQYKHIVYTHFLENECTQNLLVLDMIQQKETDIEKLVSDFVNDK